MSAPRTGPTEASLEEIARALRALDGRATLGDLIMATGRPRAAVEAAVDALMARERVEVAVDESAVLVYRLHDSGGHLRGAASRRAPATPFDRKTLQLIRARGGVVSLAELVEHTGLTVQRARQEADRLVELYGGERHTSLDRHTVYAFPDLVVSAHGAFHVREPRPAWVRADDPMDASAHDPAGGRRVVVGLGAVAAGVLAWLFTFPPQPGGRVLLLASVAGVSAGAAFAATASVLRRVAHHPRIRLRRPDILRRYLLGLVFETALKGKGVVSLDRAVAYLRARFGGTKVSRRRVERVLRGLAQEFDAPVSEVGGDRFFGFRSVKRQFLASHMERVRLRLRRQAAGRTVYDSGDSRSVAARRELEDFDRALLEPRGEARP